MRLDLRRVAEHARKADTTDLLDRVTVYRNDMEPAALDLIEGELDRRGVTRADIADHHARRQADGLFDAGGNAVRCSFCDRPAVGRAKKWYRLFGLVPLFPWLFPACDRHGPREA
jgi:hypothetical protein